jgi:uncharacterized protein YndB with AHSA1/START domain
MQDMVRQSWFFSGRPEEVWKYLTRPELLEQWLGKSNFRAESGYRFRLDGQVDCVIHGELLEVKPFSRLCYTWTTQSIKGGEMFTSTVAWTLIATGEGTELQLVHDGFGTAEDFETHREGWNILVKKLSGLVRTVKA